MIYDNKANKVHAVGNAQVYYDGGVLEADRVSYDRNANKVFAEGNVRYRARDGNVIHAQVLEMSQDFREAFVQSMLVETPQRTRFAATRTDRTGGNISVFQNGVYTACEPCRDDPRKPPLWQIKAKRIIHNEAERKIYYEDGSLELFGHPIAWVPWFYHPDPTVKRQSGFLPPHIYSSNRLGVGAEIPYFWSIAPNMDATVALAPLTRQGLLAKAEFRHRLINGAYQIRAMGIHQLDPLAFGALSTGNRKDRGMVEAQGEFNINKRWIWGFDGALISDRSFLRDYRMSSVDFKTERTSQLYLIGQGDRSYFDLRGMHFFGLSELDANSQMPVIHPVLDYSYYFGNPILGGELSYRINFTSLSRQNADFAPITAGLHQDPMDSTKCLAAAAVPANCLIRGLPGDYTRFSMQADWRRTITSDVTGILITPFVRVRGDVAHRSTNLDPTIVGYGVTENESLVRGMPAVGFEARWPFISVHSWGTQTLEPIMQAIFRPNETQIGRFPNEDAQSLVFDDTNLFAIDKYSGYDRVEGGSRLNYGLQYSANVHRFGLINVLFGQSYHMFGRNSFAFNDLTNTGAQSGLEDRTSDYVARAYFQPTGRFSFVSRFRFDKDDLSIRRFEFETRSTWDRLTLSTTYARYEAQPEIGFLLRRNGIYQLATYRFADYWSVTGGVRYDIDRDKIDFGLLTLAYTDECFVISANYIADYTNLVTSTPVHKFILRVDLRTLGGTNFSQNVSNQVTATAPTP
jgi:LPS-assembly protein